MKAEPTQSPTPRRASSSPGTASLLTRPLGLEGWEEIEPVLLAALAAEEPILLIGPHGSAKSFFLERLAQALGLVYRFYNASLINYDDLVGIPMPDDDRKSLHYISTASSIWAAEVVFFDEINRTRPELQNKLFPIIHERRVQGLPLHKLRFRWAAMNPPPVPDSTDDTLDSYLGTEPLDPALADRFPFILKVPSWQDLTREQRKRIFRDQYSGSHPFEIDPLSLIEKARRSLGDLQSAPPAALADYLLGLLDHLEKANLRLSTRRATMLHRNILAVHAARTTAAALADKEGGQEVPSWSDSAILAVTNSLPQIAQGRPIDQALILAAHRQAWEVANLDDADPWRTLLQIKEPETRCIVALRMGPEIDDDRLSDLILDALADQPDDTARSIFSLVVYAAVHESREIRATVYETMSRYLQKILRPGVTHLKDGPVTKYAEIKALIAEFPKTPDGTLCLRDRYAANLLNGLFPAAFRQTPPREIYARFKDLWRRIIEEGPAPSGRRP